MTQPHCSPEDVWAAYQSCIHLFCAEGDVQWRAAGVFFPFAALLAAGAMLSSFVGSDDPRAISVAGLVVSLIGVMVSIMWWSMVSRSLTYHKYWIICARELERLMSEEVKTLLRGQQLASGDAITVDGVSIRMSTISRLAITRTMYLLYGLFVLAFVALAGLSFYGIVVAF